MVNHLSKREGAPQSDPHPLSSLLGKWSYTDLLFYSSVYLYLNKTIISGKNPDQKIIDPRPLTIYLLAGVYACFILECLGLYLG